ncbi:hypothetical protein [Bowmanella dokdonensis]|uniref:Uncharacterized protein n=1 Tax=Bowmanella dokdonensis TaxID=751969 RepID=A0A939ISG2_9ALTE|nr:hypothetical protein [Bowmanella dokdonensis]MBN7826396.1 hypothetical protein [Bowmanella dokdonensis]
MRKRSTYKPRKPLQPSPRRRLMMKALRRKIQLRRQQYLDSDYSVVVAQAS